MNIANLDLTPLVNALIVLLAAVVTRYLVPWLKAQAAKAKSGMSESQLWVYETIARVAVNAAEQIYDDNKQKLEYAMEVFERSCEQKGLSYDSSLARAYIEDAVRHLKDLVDAPAAKPVEGFAQTTVTEES